VPILDRAADDAAIASLKEHPGMKALLNRFRLQQEALKSRLEGTRHKDLRDVDSCQLGLYWLGFAESQIRASIGKAQERETPVLAQSEILEFERILSAIETVGTTSS